MIDLTVLLLLYSYSYMIDYTILLLYHSLLSIDRIDYAMIESEIKIIALKHEHHLLEDFGEDIIGRLKEKFHFEKIILKISKQKILPDTDFVGVILER